MNRSAYSLESLVRGGEVVLCWGVQRVRGYDSIVGSNFQHVFTTLLWSTIHSECIFVLVNSAPVFKVGLERSLNLPVLDQVLNDLL